MSDTAPIARLQSLDTVRGVAVMGILLLNIVAFSMPMAAYFNPRAYGGAEGIDLTVYLANFVLFDGKMRGLFSFLFGASILMVIQRAEAKGESPARVHYMRMIWLLLFGLVHLWLVWFGDILGHYALIGMLAYFLRNVRPARLVIFGVLMVLVQAMIFAFLPVMVHALQSAPADPDAAKKAAQSLAELNRGFGIPTAGEIAKNLAIYRGDYAGIFAERLRENPTGPVTTTLLFGFETLAYMMFGMAALKTGLLRGDWDRARYRKWLWIGFGIGIPAYAALAVYLINADFNLFSIVLGAMMLPTLFRPFMIVGWACLIILLARPGGALTSRIAATGRMAFTNYLTTSLICTTLFYGYGLGWYGYLGRAELYLVVFAVWALMLLWSKPWLARFRYGPLEWLWRSLSRLSFQPIRGAAAASD
ncbi:DUF418 domain-containing protein [Sphingomonas sp. G-3-2-10]|uniref:DUF418 domain-containing protein n=1 Tax=Sphingomonas sp. G-3-2-10 TaxID=2728838 RepID=UPI00146C0B99|nr:DUF418 domain-containing protein [Sphingomonas sp. G-3-2-10]NML06384.1 DUF418 domain-containing protein [Sphingomonas sp. G-3-2-10]